MKTYLVIFSLTVALLAIPTATPSIAVGDGQREFNFEVFLDDRAIGFHRFELSPTQEGVRLVTEADFEVRFLGITAFAYEHRNTELWRDGCLQSIDARTDSNGKRSSVTGRLKGREFILGEGARTLGDCVATFAYWDKDILLQRQRLLNSQTAEYMPIRIEALGQDRLRIGSRDIPVRRYKLGGEGLDITITYAVGSNEWVALDSRLDNGRTLRYRRSLSELSSLSPGEQRVSTQG